MMEIWDVYDANRVKTGKTMVRGDVFEKGTFHLAVHVCVFSTDGRMLIQRRQADKELFPGLWDLSVGGSALAGEDACAAAERELFEELGIRHDFGGVLPNMTFNFNHGFDDVFLIQKDIDIRGVVLQKEEVQDVMWASRDEIGKMIEDGRFIPYYPSLIGVLFESVGRYGMHTKEF